MMLIKPGWNGRAFILPDDTIIADIGFGNDPIRGATYYIDRDLGESQDRGGMTAGQVPPDRFIQADIERGIPLPDQSCDFVVASHLLEHLNDPKFFCKELERVGKKGYIETPGVIMEIIDNRTVHKWYVFKFRDTLYFIKKSHIPRKSRLLGERFYPAAIIRTIFGCTCFPWEGKIKCKVIA